MFLIELITLPCKYELMSVRIEVALNEALLHRSSSYFFLWQLKIPDMVHHNNTPLLNTVNIYKRSLQD